MIYYTVYNEGEDIIAFGDSVKCANMLEMSVEYFYCMVGRVKRGENKKYHIVKEKIERGGEL